MSLETTILDDIFPETGGPAFPFVTNERGQIVFTGMSLRDYFAAKAMQGLLAEGSTHIKDGWNEQTISHDAYHIADAMLAERDKNA